MFSPGISETLITLKVKARHSFDTIHSEKTIFKDNSSIPVCPKRKSLASISKILFFESPSKRKIPVENTPGKRVKIESHPNEKKLNLKDPETGEITSYCVYPDQSPHLIRNNSENITSDEDCQTDDEIIQMASEYLIHQVKSALISESQ